MSISESSSLKLFMAVSLITLVRMYFCCFLLSSEIPRLTIHGRWSDTLLNIMLDEMATCFLWGVLQNIWSIRLHECLANLVGKVILGKKLFVHIKSRKSSNLSRSEICNRFILKSPTIAAYVFSRWSIFMIGESSDMNCCILALLLLSWGGRYIFPIVNVRQRLPYTVRYCICANHALWLPLCVYVCLYPEASVAHKYDRCFSWRRIVLMYHTVMHVYCTVVLTHWGRVTHTCVTKLTIIGSNNGLSPGRRQAIIWTNDGILLIWPLGTNFSEMFIGIHIFSFKKMHLKMSSEYRRPFCLGLNVLEMSFVIKNFNFCKCDKFCIRLTRLTLISEKRISVFCKSHSVPDTINTGICWYIRMLFKLRKLCCQRIALVTELI